MRFINEYTQHPLLRFSPSRRTSTLFTPTSTGADTAKTPDDTHETNGTDARVPGSPLLTRALHLGTAPTRVRTGTYPLSTVIIVALIAFLVGSLLRSLLSPADFIYVVTDEKEIGNVSAGWREIKRLLEVKYVVGGWDFQIAVVRRH